jgi:hypothetical protein
MAVIDSGNASAGKANVDADYNLRVNSPGYDKDGVIRGGGDVNAGAITMFAEVDNGSKTGVRRTISVDVDQDNRQRISSDNLLDQENFNYTAQNTGKHSHTFTTLTATCSAAGLLTNSAAITTTTTGMTFGTFAMFPVGGTQTTVCETSVAFTAQPNANTVIDFGLFQRGVTTAFLGLDGAYFRMSSAGLQGVINSGGVETATGVFPLSGGTGTWVYLNNAVNKYRVQITNVSTTFWINDLLYGEIVNPSAGFPCKSVALPWSIRHAIVGGAAGAACSALITDYRVMIRGPIYADTLGSVGNRVFGSYQGLSGGTMGSLANYANSTNPVAAVPTNTTAALGTGLGGQVWETFSAAVNTDLIICSYLVPAGTTLISGRRLRIRGVSLASYIQTVLAGGPAVTQYTLAFGHTALSLATAESASFGTFNGTTKAPRRIALPPLTQAITAAQAVSTLVSQPGGGTFQFEAPVYVNPGEFVALVAKHVGTVGTSGTIAHVIGFDYSWE